MLDKTICKPEANETKKKIYTKQQQRFIESEKKSTLWTIFFFGELKLVKDSPMKKKGIFIQTVSSPNDTNETFLFALRIMTFLSYFENI